MLSAICYSLDQSKILLSGNGLTGIKRCEKRKKNAVFISLLSLVVKAEPHNSGNSVANFRTGGRGLMIVIATRLVPLSLLSVVFPRIDDSHWDKIGSSFTTVCCFSED